MSPPDPRSVEHRSPVAPHNGPLSQHPCRHGDWLLLGDSDGSLRAARALMGFHAQAARAQTALTAHSVAAP